MDLIFLNYTTDGVKLKTCGWLDCMVLDMQKHTSISKGCMRKLSVTS